MGLFSWLFGETKSKPHLKKSPRVKMPTTPENVNFIRGDGSFSFEVVGESHYQSALQWICGPRKEDGENKQEIALLIFEDSNPHDNQAVCVKIRGKRVGYLSRDDARTFREMVRQANIPDNGLDLACYAVIRGGWDRGEEDEGLYGVWLDIPVED